METVAVEWRCPAPYCRQVPLAAISARSGVFRDELPTSAVAQPDTTFHLCLGTLQYEKARFPRVKRTRFVFPGASLIRLKPLSALGGCGTVFVDGSDRYS